MLHRANEALLVSRELLLALENHEFAIPGTAYGKIHQQLTLPSSFLYFRPKMCDQRSKQSSRRRGGRRLLQIYRAFWKAISTCP